MSTLQLFKGFPTTKSDIQIAVKNCKAEILGGDFNPLEIDLHLKKMEELIKGIRDDKEVKNAVFTELEKYTEKTVEFSGCEVTKVNRSAYDYDLCNDSDLQDLEREAERVNSALKDRQRFLQGLKEELTIVNQKSGEIETIYPPLKKSTETFSIKIL